jgi:hypothetical protein
MSNDEKRVSEQPSGDTEAQLIRPSAATLIAGLTSTSEKIRALARAGYLRKEISAMLAVRYQHVRKVLVDAGIASGLRRDVEYERQPVLVDTSNEPRQPTRGDFLLDNGFRYLGEWVAMADRELQLNVRAPVDRGVYAFLLDDVVVYVGLAQRGFRTRMGHYRRGYVGQKTSARVKSLIAAALAEGKHVKVLITTPENDKWNGLPIDRGAGLEAGLIRQLQPQWNMLGKSPQTRRACGWVQLQP